MKRNNYKLLILTLLMGMLGNIAQANVYHVNDKGVDYRVVFPGNNTSPKAYVVSSNNGKYSGDIVIPQTISFFSRTCYVEGIDQYAFKDCSELKSVTILGGVKVIGRSAFENCTGLTSVTLSSSVTNLNNRSFANCTGLSSFIIPDGVTTISGSVFSGCTGLTSITIPNSVTVIGGGIFSGCENLISLSVSEDNKIFDSREDCNAIIETESNKLIVGCKTTVIPNSVTSIGERAFYGCSGLTSVTIPNSVTSIGIWAFFECCDLTSVTIANSVTSIGGYAFKNCSSMTSITIPNSVTSIGESAFDDTIWYNNQPDGLVYAGKVAYKYKGLMPENTNISLKEGTLSIAPKAFADCTGLASITIPNSVIEICDVAFYNCSGLTSITIPNSVIEIGGVAFKNCTGLTSITIPSSVMSIGFGVFEGCTLNSVTINSNSILSMDFTEYSLSDFIGDNVYTYIIGDDVTSIGYHAFYGCKKLYAVIIGNNVTSISEGAFEGCNNLTSISFPDNLTMIDLNAFSSTAWYNNQPDGLVYAGKVAYKYKGTMPADTSIILEEGTVSIASAAFLGHSNLTSVIIPNSVTCIGQQAFKECTSITSITIPSTVNSIGSSAFEGCSSLISIMIPNSLTKIDSRLFYGCSDLTSITIPNSVTSIGDYAFLGCNGLKKVIVPDVAAWCGISFGYSSNPLYYAHHIFSNEDTEIIDLIIPNGVMSIGNSAFNGCSGLTSVTIPNSVTSIGESAFYGCSGLTSVTIPNSVTSIGESAFFGCTGLTSIEIPNSVTSIGGETFNGCSGLTSVTIPNSVTSIGDYAFSGCSGLTSVTIPNSVTTIGEYAFQSCTGLRSITIPNSITRIDGSTFEGCTGIYSANIAYKEIGYWVSGMPNLRKLILGEGVETIINLSDYCPNIDSLEFHCTKIPYWFYRNATIKDVVIGDEVTTIDNNAFAYCTGISTFSIGKNVTSVGEGVFIGCIRLDSLAINCNTVGQWFEVPNTLRSVFIGEETKNISDRAFADCGELTTVHIGNNVESIGNYAFWNCKKLEKVTWGNSLIKIGVSAFRNSAIQSIKLPSSMKDIDLQAFYGCDYLKEIYTQIKDPFQISIIIFDDQAYRYATLYVPLGCVAKYKSVGSWNKFNKIKAWNFSNTPGDVTGTGTVNVQDATLTVNYILGDECDEYDYSVADMNNDGEIDVFDVQAIINVILSNDNTASTRNNRAYVAGVESVLLKADNNSLLLAINNPERFTSFQFDVEVPEGMSLSDVTWTGTTDHSLQFSKTDENQYTVVALSMDSTPLPALSGGLVKLHLSDEADGEVILDNILFVTPKGEAVHFCSSKVDAVTGIQKVTRIEDVKVYDLSGRQLKTNPNQLPKGVYIINKKKVVVK